MNETEEWIQKYIQKQIEGMVFRSEEERQHRIQQARQSAEAYLQAYQRQSRGKEPLICPDPNCPEEMVFTGKLFMCPRCNKSYSTETLMRAGIVPKPHQFEKKAQSQGNPENVQQKRFGLWQDGGSSENPQVSQKVANYLQNLGYIVKVQKVVLGPPGSEWTEWNVWFDTPASMTYPERVKKGNEFWQKHDQIIKKMYSEA